MAKSRQYDLRQEAKYAAQLRQMSSRSRAVTIKSYWKWAVALGAMTPIMAVAVLGTGVTF